MTTRRVVFAGSPGGGKSTLLQVLQQEHGHQVAEDSARAIIQARKRAAQSPRPSPVEFAQAILNRDIKQYSLHSPNSGMVFFERGVVDASGMLSELGAMPDDQLHELLLAYPYHRQVFLFPPWEAIFVTDAERDQTFQDAAHVYRATLEWYTHCGYRVVEMPKVSLAERCQFVLRVLNSDA